MTRKTPNGEVRLSRSLSADRLNAELTVEKKSHKKRTTRRRSHIGSDRKTPSPPLNRQQSLATTVDRAEEAQCSALERARSVSMAVAAQPRPCFSSLPPPQTPDQITTSAGINLRHTVCFASLQQQLELEAQRETLRGSGGKAVDDLVLRDVSLIPLDDALDPTSLNDSLYPSKVESEFASEAAAADEGTLRRETSKTPSPVSSSPCSTDVSPNTSSVSLLSSSNTQLSVKAARMLQQLQEKERKDREQALRRKASKQAPSTPSSAFNSAASDALVRRSGSKRKKDPALVAAAAAASVGSPLKNSSITAINHQNSSDILLFDAPVSSPARSGSISSASTPCISSQASSHSSSSSSFTSAAFLRGSGEVPIEQKGPAPALQEIAEEDLAAVEKMEHFQEFKRMIKLFFADFDGSYFDLLTGMMLLATFHTSTFTRTNLIVRSLALHACRAFWLLMDVLSLELGAR